MCVQLCVCPHASSINIQQVRRQEWRSRPCGFAGFLYIYMPSCYCVCVIVVMVMGSYSEGDGKDGVGADVGLVGRPVHLVHLCAESRLD